MQAGDSVKNLCIKNKMKKAQPGCRFGICWQSQCHFQVFILERLKTRTTWKIFWRSVIKIVVTYPFTLSLPLLVLFVQGHTLNELMVSAQWIFHLYHTQKMQVQSVIVFKFNDQQLIGHEAKKLLVLDIIPSKLEKTTRYICYETCCDNDSTEPVLWENNWIQLLLSV